MELSANGIAALSNVPSSPTASTKHRRFSGLPPSSKASGESSRSPVARPRAGGADPWAYPPHRRTQRPVLERIGRHRATPAQALQPKTGNDHDGRRVLGSLGLGLVLARHNSRLAVPRRGGVAAGLVAGLANRGFGNRKGGGGAGQSGNLLRISFGLERTQGEAQIDASLRGGFDLAPLLFGFRPRLRHRGDHSSSDRPVFSFRMATHFRVMRTPGCTL